MDKIEQLKVWIQESNYMVFFGGAGVSTQSGIPDFRSKDGLYHQKYDYPPEEILSHSFFMKHTEAFFQFYKDKFNCLQAKPNRVHLKLATLEKKGILKAIITQNMDGLHQKAGSRQVYELHGSIFRNYCMQCHKFYEAYDIFHHIGIPHCSCGGIIKPDVVLYEEPLNESTLFWSIEHIRKADLLLVGGTSLMVYPAAGLLHDFRGKHLVLINQEETPYDEQANLVIHDSLNSVFENL